MGANDNVQFAISKVLKGLGFLFGCSEAIHVINRNRHVFESLGKGAKMLVGKNGCGYQNGYLFAIIHRLKCRADGHFGFAKAHIATHQTIHWSIAFHVVFDVLGGFELIGCVFVDERTF